MNSLIFATRPSALARHQTRSIIALLSKSHLEIEFQEVVISTSGDRNLNQPLPEIGGKGLFTQELEQQLLDEQVDVAVHSLKDLPVEITPGLTIGAIPGRAEARDALISGKGLGLNSLPEGAFVGTSSLRRAAQLLAFRPDLQIRSLRGNVDTRLQKALRGEYDAIILAGAGLERLGLVDHVSEWLPLEVMLPAPGQGALAVQCRARDERVLRLLSAIEDTAVRKATQAERAFLSALGGGCSLPVAALAGVQGDRISLQGFVGSPDGSATVRCSAEGQDPDDVGEKCASLAVEQGAGEILSAFHTQTN